MTDNEKYLHYVNQLVDEGKDISKIYNHRNYLEASNAICITKNKEEPRLDEIFGCMFFGMVIFSAINIYGGI